MNQDPPAGDAVLAVHEKDLDKLLGEIGLLQDLEGPGIPCKICQLIVTRKNLGYIFFVEGRHEICCDRIVCYYQFMKSLRKLGRTQS